jgi:hypothetical protein
MVDNLQKVGGALTSVGKTLGSFGGRVKKVAAIVVISGSVIASLGVVASTWDSLGLPRFAYASELNTLTEQLKSYSTETNKQIKTLISENKGTRELIYYARLNALRSELTALRARLKRQPNNIDLQQRITAKEGELKILNKKLGLE